MAAVAVGLGWIGASDLSAVAKQPGVARTAASRASAPAATTAIRQTFSGPTFSGHVQFVTDKRAYLDRGSRDGLTEGQSLQMFRGGRPIASCKLDTLADLQASCVGGRLRPGDTFRLAPRSGAKKRDPAAPNLPPLVDQDTLRERAERVAAASYEKVNFSGRRAFASHASGLLTPAFTVWHSQSDPRGDYVQEQLDGSIHVYDLGATGLRFDAAFTAMHWGGRDSFGRFRPSAPAQFYLWEAEVSKRHADASTVFAVGRIWPWHTPGLTLLDGFQVGRHNKSETVEAGAYAGLIPLAVNVNPSVAAWASGLYGALVQVGDNNMMFRLAREEARLGVWRAPGAGLVTEGEILAQAWLGPFNLGGGGRVRAASAIPGGPALDRAYVDLGSRATLKLGGGLHLRYFGAALPDEVLLAAETQAPKGSIHVVGDVHWDIFAWLGFAGFGGVHRDRDSGRSQDIGAAEIRLPRLFRDFGGVWLGAEASEGWMRGRLLYGQILGRFLDRVQVLARVSASASQFRIPDTSPNLHELGGTLQIDGMISSSLRLRAWSLIRVPLFVLAEPPIEPGLGIVAGLSVTGVF